MMRYCRACILPDTRPNLVIGGRWSVQRLLPRTRPSASSIGRRVKAAFKARALPMPRRAAVATIASSR